MDKVIIEQIINDHKKLRNEEKYFIKNHGTLFTLICINRYVFYSLTSQRDRQIFKEQLHIYERNIHRKNQSCILIRGEEIRFFSILHFVFYSLTYRPTYTIFIKKILIYDRSVHKKISTLILIRREENRVFNIFTFLPFAA